MGLLSILKLFSYSFAPFVAIEMQHFATNLVVLTSSVGLRTHKSVFILSLLGLWLYRIPRWVNNKPLFAKLSYLKILLNLKLKEYSRVNSCNLLLDIDEHVSFNSKL